MPKKDTINSNTLIDSKSILSDLQKFYKKIAKSKKNSYFDMPAKTRKFNEYHDFLSVVLESIKDDKQIFIDAFNDILNNGFDDILNNGFDD